MSFPKQSEIELPLLKTLQELGGKAEPKELYQRLAAIFPQLTEEDLAARLPSSPSACRFLVRLVTSSSKLLLEAQTAESTASAYSERCCHDSLRFSGEALAAKSSQPPGD